MNNRLLILALLALPLTGCTQLDLGGVGKYQSFLFKKGFSDLTVSQSVTPSGTNILLRVKGYSSGAEALVQAVAAGVADGMTKANGQPITK